MTPVNPIVLLWMLGMQLVVIDDNKTRREWGWALIIAAWVVQAIAGIIDIVK